MDWKQKLTSRKLWMAVAGFVGMLVAAFGGSAEGAERVTALIMAGASVIAYIIGEGLIDAQYKGEVFYEALPVEMPMEAQEAKGTEGPKENG